VRSTREILDEWRDAQRALEAATMPDERAILASRVDTLRSEYLAVFAQLAGRPSGELPAHEQLAGTSDAVLAIARRLVAIEEEKRGVGIGTAQFEVLATEVEELSRRLLEFAREQRVGGVVTPPTTRTLEDVARDD
jgi:hypothetical protein